MRLLKEMWQDIRQGANIDLYLTVGAAILCLLLQLVGVPIQQYLPAIMLALLTLVSINMLANRKQLEDLITTSKTTQSGILSHTFPPDFQHNLDKVDSLWIIGVSAARLIVEDYPQQIRRILRRNGCVNILIVDSNSPAYGIATTRDVLSNTDYQISRTKATISTVSVFKKENPGKVQLRTTKYPLDFETIIVSIEERQVIYMRHYGYKTELGTEPKITIDSRRDPEWFSYFRTHFQNLWESGSEFEDA